MYLLLLYNLFQDSTSLLTFYVLRLTSWYNNLCMEISTVSTPTQWDEQLAAQQGHLLQSWAWGNLKSQFGWTAYRIQTGQAAAQLLFRRLPLGRTLAYIPKGPTLEGGTSEDYRRLLAAVHAEADRRKAIFLKIEPDGYTPEPFSPDSLPQGSRSLVEVLNLEGFVPGDTIQPHTSIVIDIRGDEEAILAAMKQKTRYNIRLAQKKGITFRQGGEGDLRSFYDLARLTARRDGFGIHNLAYYQRAYRLFAPHSCVLLLAEFEGEILAASMIFKFGRNAYYFYGASSNTHRNLMPAYLIQWAAICWAKEQGCTCYDLWGIPDANPDTLEEEFQERQGGLWGVYRFKRGFGGQIVKSAGAYDYVYQPLWYKFYRWRRNV
jgi:peptidoglycan pentaglycine glycine transferase (the first glycine)